MSQAQDKWGKDGAATMWDNAAVRVIAGGGGNIDDLEEASKLLGDIQLPSGESLGRRVLTAAEIRTLPFGRAVVVARDARPVEVMLTPWWKRKDGKEIATAKSRAEALIRHYQDKAGQDSKVQQYMRSSTN
jgi:type IV secretory pathway TraG/TraD family ATPase VirD4